MQRTELSLRQPIILLHVSTRSLTTWLEVAAAVGAYLALAFFFVLREIHLSGERELPRTPEDSRLRCHAGKRTEERENSGSYTKESI